eukprot:m.188047 g.188047  ORF g.188047 m.188047 type:complete len:86 (+) comp10021_c1_seq33:86-343(+)
MKLLSLSTIAVLLLASVVTKAQAGPISYQTCQSHCATAATACYTTAYLAFAVVLPGTVSDPILACNIVLGACNKACTVALLAPTP